MNPDDTEKNQVRKVYIPPVNEYPLKDIHRWAKMAYHMARVQVSRRKAEKIKEIMPIEMAAYAEEKVFGNWRLVAPAGEDMASPLQQALTWLRPQIVPTRWNVFRHKFARLLKLAFNAIHHSDYDPKIVEQMNEWLNKLIGEFGIRSAECGMKNTKVNTPHSEFYIPHLSFVLRPETAVGYSAPEILAMRSSIWERFTGQPLNPAQFLNPTAAGRQMAMELVISPGSVK